MTKTAYHGTNVLFKKFEQSKARIMNDFYGGGVAYFTDNERVARQYAKINTKTMGGVPHVYVVELRLKKVFDVDDTFTGKRLTQFYNTRDSKEIQEFARRSGLAKLGGDDIYTVMVRLKDGKYTLTGDQVWRGLSGGQSYTAKAREKLKKLGYNALRYNGGVQMNAAIRHDVYCMYDASDIKITRIYKITKSLKESVINIARADMPQIPNDDIETFLQHIRDDGIGVESVLVDPDTLNPTQTEFDMAKVKKIKKNNNMDKRVLVSSDNFILDGHHRWLSAMKTVPIHRIDMPILELLKYTKTYCNHDQERKMTLLRNVSLKVWDLKKKGLTSG